MNITQCRMVRAGLGWSLDDVAEQSGIARRTVARFEAGESVKPETMETLRQCFVRAGAEFINGGQSIGVKVPRLSDELERRRQQLREGQAAHGKVERLIARKRKERGQ